MSDDRARQRALGVAALLATLFCFSFGSTLIKLSETPGVTVAFWRLLLCSGIWVLILRIAEHRWPTREGFRAALVPGIAFGDDRCIRLSCAAGEATITDGLARLQRFIAAL